MSIVAIKNFGNIKGLFGMNFEMIILFTKGQYSPRSTP